MKNHENILRVVRCLVDFVVLCDSKILQKFFVRDLVDFLGLLGCFLVGIYFPYCNWIILVSSDRKYFSLIVVEWLWGKRSHHHVSSCVANDDKPCILACFWQTLQKMSVGCIHQDFQVVLFLLMFLSKITKSYRKNLQALMAQKQTWWWPMHSKAVVGCWKLMSGHQSVSRLKKRGPKKHPKTTGFCPILAGNLTTAGRGVGRTPPIALNEEQVRSGNLWANTELSVLQIWVMNHEANS